MCVGNPDARVVLVARVAARVDPDPIPVVHLELEAPAVARVAAEVVEEAVGVEAVVELLEHEVDLLDVELPRRGEEDGVGGLGEAAGAGNQSVPREPVERAAAPAEPLVLGQGDVDRVPGIAVVVRGDEADDVVDPDRLGQVGVAELGVRDVRERARTPRGDAVAPARRDAEALAPRASPRPIVPRRIASSASCCATPWDRALDPLARSCPGARRTGATTRPTTGRAERGSGRSSRPVRASGSTSSVGLRCAHRAERPRQPCEVAPREPVGRGGGPDGGFGCEQRCGPPVGRDEADPPVRRVAPKGGRRVAGAAEDAHDGRGRVCVLAQPVVVCRGLEPQQVVLRDAPRYAFHSPITTASRVAPVASIWW